MERSGGGIVDGYKKCRKKIGGKAGDKVAQLSSLSPAQVENVQLLREKYLLEMPNPNDPTAREQTMLSHPFLTQKLSYSFQDD